MPIPDSIGVSVKECLDTIRTHQPVAVTSSDSIAAPVHYAEVAGMVQGFGLPTPSSRTMTDAELVARTITGVLDAIEALEYRLRIVCARLHEARAILERPKT